MARLRGWHRVIAVSSIWAAGSCVPGDPPAGEFPAAGDAAVTASDAAAEQGPDTALVADGTWLQFTQTYDCVLAAGVTQAALSWGLALIELKESQGGVLDHTYRLCGIDQTPILALPTVIPLAVTDHIPTRHVLGILDSGRIGASYETEIDIELWGVRLDNLETDTLPTDATDPRVFDQDLDGQPGVTLRVGVDFCEMHVVQRGVKQWKGVVQSATRIAGGGMSTSQQNVLSATTPLCAAPVITWFPDGLARFEMIRVDGKHGGIDLDTNQDGQITCDEVRAYGTGPFNPSQPDNANCKSGPPQ